LLEAWTGLGLVLGPVFGSFLYYEAGYAGTFYIFGTAQIIFGGFLLFYLPKEKQKYIPLRVDDESQTEVVDEEELNAD
jgi:MFS family permease